MTDVEKTIPVKNPQKKKHEKKSLKNYLVPWQNIKASWIKKKFENKLKKGKQTLCGGYS